MLSRWALVRSKLGRPELQTAASPKSPSRRSKHDRRLVYSPGSPPSSRNKTTARTSFFSVVALAVRRGLLHRLFRGLGSGRIWVTPPEELEAALDNRSHEATNIEQQTVRALSSTKTIWSAVRQADFLEVRRMVEECPLLLRERGPVGDTPTLVCFLYGSEPHLRIVEWILNKFPSCARDTYQGKEYYGETCLHIAIIQGNLAWVKRLVEQAPQLLDMGATGEFFQRDKPCYYGEYPLGFAVCTDQEEVARYLMSVGAPLHRQDTDGNTLLHLAVLHSKPEMYDLVEKAWQAQHPHADETTQLAMKLNKERLTPLTLAAHTNNKEMFAWLLHRQRMVQWTWGPVTCILHPLAQIDGWDQQPNQEKEECPPDALSIILRQGYVDLLGEPLISDLVEKKWKRFARSIFLQRFVAFFVYICLFSLNVILFHTQPKRHADPLTMAEWRGALALSGLSACWRTRAGASLLTNTLACLTCGLASLCRLDARLLLSGALDVLVLLGACYKGWKEARELCARGIDYFRAQGCGMMENILSSSFCLCTLLYYPFLCCGLPGAQVLLALASLLGWTYMLWFL
eukprot:g12152.t1